MKQKYAIRLTETERYQLKQFISSGEAPARKLRRTHILLKSDSSEGGLNWLYQAILEAFEVSNVTISDVRRTFAERGLEAALNRKKPEQAYERRFDGEAEAHPVALVCSPAPEGHERWTLRLIKKHLIQLGVVADCSHETVRTTLKK